MTLSAGGCGSPGRVRLAIGALLVAVTLAGAGAQGDRSDGPPLPFEDVGACPFEGCVYREWVAKTSVLVRSDRRPGASVVFTLSKGDRVRAITGIVVTTKPGRVQFRIPADLWTTAGTLHIQPGELLFLLTYHGEGATTAWFKGRLYDEVDGAEFFNGMCERKPGMCNGIILERPESVWWIRLRNMRGLRGWTNEGEKFDNIDRFGADRRVESPDKRAARG